MYLQFSQLIRPLAAVLVMNTVHDGAHYCLFCFRVLEVLQKKSILRKTLSQRSEVMLKKFEYISMLWLTAESLCEFAFKSYYVFSGLSVTLLTFRKKKTQYESFGGHATLWETLPRAESHVGGCKSRILFKYSIVARSCTCLLVWLLNFYVCILYFHFDNWHKHDCQSFYFYFQHQCLSIKIEIKARAFICTLIKFKCF